MYTIIFFISLFCTVYFIAKLITWQTIMINPKAKLKKEFKNSDIRLANIIGFIALIGWTMLFHFLTNK